MKALAPHDRPREKLGRLGPSGLGDNELLAIVLGAGARARSALDVANQILAAVNGVQGLTRANQSQLTLLSGVGPARAAQILAAVELGRRTLLRRERARPRLVTPCELAEYLLPQFSARSVEHFGIVLLDTKQRLLKTVMLSVGTLDASLAHPRDVFREATIGGAASVVLFHNHPSGDPSPSREDALLTWRLVAAGELMGIDVADHLILADSRYYSFREHQRLRGGP